MKRPYNFLMWSSWCKLWWLDGLIPHDGSSPRLTGDPILKVKAPVAMGGTPIKDGSRPHWTGRYCSNRHGFLPNILHSYVAYTIDEFSSFQSSKDSIMEMCMWMWNFQLPMMKTYYPPLMFHKVGPRTCSFLVFLVNE